MTATSKLDSVLLDVTVTDPTRQRATDIVNAVGQVFPDLVAELERPTKPDTTASSCCTSGAIQRKCRSRLFSTGLPTMLCAGPCWLASLWCRTARLCETRLMSPSSHPSSSSDAAGAPISGPSRTIRRFRSVRSSCMKTRNRPVRSLSPIAYESSIRRCRQSRVR